VDLHIVDYKGASAYKPLCHIFPNSAISKKWYERRLDAMLTAVGEDLTLYSVHSLRAGGVTELFLSGVIPVQIYGRWKFESALIYFRDASGIMAYAAAKAFETEVFSCIGGNDH